MSGRRRMLAGAAICVTSVACGGGEQIALGRERLARSDEGECSGAADCSGTDTPTPPSAIVPPAAPCTGTAGQLPIALRVSPSAQEVCSEGEHCQLSLEKLAPAGDGSVWLLGTIIRFPHGPSAERNWLAHFAGDGTKLGEWTGEGGASPLLALDDRGQAWVAMGRTARFSLRRFDQEVRPVGATIAVSHVRSLVTDAGRGVSVLTGDDLSQYDYVGALLRREALDPVTGPNAIVTSAVGSARLTIIPIPPSQNYGGFAAIENGLTVARFDHDQEALWTSQSKLIQTRPAITISDLADVFSALGRDGNLIVAVTPPPSGTPIGAPFVPNPGLVDIESIDASGRSRWILRASASFNGGIALGPDGAVWVADFEGERARGMDPYRPPPNGHIAVIEQDGSSCRRYAYEGIEMVNDLVFSSTDELWFLDHDAFGRFAPPSP